MLRSLHIENIAVIKTLDLDIADGFTAMTGETGAGKSIIIDSINFLLCNRTGRELVRTGQDRAVVSAVFDGIGGGIAEELAELGIECEDGELSLGRTLTADGRSTCRINARGVTQAVLRRVGGLLVSIHGQNENIKLTDPAEQLRLLDAAAHAEGVLAEYGEIYSALTAVRGEIDGLCRDEKELNQLRDMLEYQIKDISALKLKAGEEASLLIEKKRLLSLETIKKQSDIALRAIHGNERGVTASYLLTKAADALRRISDVYPEYLEYAERLEACRYETDDIAAEVMSRSGVDDDEDADPTARLDAIETRLDAISRLKKKYGSTVEEILEFKVNAEARLAALETGDERIAELRRRELELCESLQERGGVLGELRRAAAAGIEGRVAESLAFLDMPKVRFCIAIDRLDEPTPRGYDRAEFRIAPNPGEPPRSLAKIASGGELSRIMLSIKSVMADLDGVPTVIYDEVDAGISGKTSRKVGIKLREAAGASQILCVTHSAQIASLAANHLLITKTERDGMSESTVTYLDDDGRVEETARILGGINITEAQRAAARELIAEGADVKSGHNIRTETELKDR